MNKITFRGAGCNGPSLMAAISRATDSPSKDTVPAGATWPLVTLSISDEAVDFSLAHIQRHVTAADIVEIHLSKLGYVFFHTQDQSKDFGFATLKLKALMKELSKHGYTLSESCRRNLFIAKASLIASTAIPVAIFIAVTILGILRPHGI